MQDNKSEDMIQNEEKEADGPPEKNLDNEANGNKEKIEAALRAKYPMAGRSCHSAFLQKKLAKGQKYFDSGDYQMARQSTGGGVTKGRQSQAAAPFFNFPTGEAIPTPESVPVRKTSIIQPKFHGAVPPPLNPAQTTATGHSQLSAHHPTSASHENSSESSENI